MRGAGYTVGMKLLSRSERITCWHSSQGIIRGYLMRFCSIFGWIAMEIVPLVGAAFLFLAGSVFGEESKPNIIVIMADDLGYGDVGCYGSKTIPTPHLDRMAAEGIRFTSGYSPASTCTPTRYSLLTGEFAFRRKGTGVAPPNQSPGCAGRKANASPGAQASRLSNGSDRQVASGVRGPRWTRLEWFVAAGSHGTWF